MTDKERIEILARALKVISVWAHNHRGDPQCIEDQFEDIYLTAKKALEETT